MPIDEPNEMVCDGAGSAGEVDVRSRPFAETARSRSATNNKIKGDESVMNVCYATRSNSVAPSMCGYLCTRAIVLLAGLAKSL